VPAVTYLGILVPSVLVVRRRIPIMTALVMRIRFALVISVMGSRVVAASVVRSRRRAGMFVMSTRGMPGIPTCVASESGKGYKQEQRYECSGLPNLDHGCLPLKLAAIDRHLSTMVTGNIPSGHLSIKEISLPEETT